MLDKAHSLWSEHVETRKEAEKNYLEKENNFSATPQGLAKQLMKHQRIFHLKLKYMIWIKKISISQQKISCFLSKIMISNSA
jgi:hypothetical protein